VCQFCALKTFRATVQLLQSEVEGLRSELADARALIKQQPALPQGTQGSYEAKSYAAAVSSDEEKRCSIQGQGKRKKQGKPAAPSGHGNSESVGNSQSPRQHTVANKGPRVRVEGARRVWGTMKHTTTKSIKNAISRFCKIEGLNIKRKVHSNPSSKKESWWFVVHANEVLLSELDNKWNSVNLQTSWVLQHCSKPADTASPTNDSSTDGSDITSKTSTYQKKSP